MRTLRYLLVLVAALGLLAAGPAMAEEATAPEAPAAVAEEAVPEPDAVPTPPLVFGAMAEVFGTTAIDLAPMASFGPHCSGLPNPWTCSYTEPGLGCWTGGHCTYSCQCDECTMSDGRIETVAINCTLVDDGGCLACPM